MPTARTARRTQAQRTAQTRGALLDATLDCLTDVGFGRTTTTEVARRAAVSLGALVHHFPVKSDLLTAAVGHLLERRLQEFRAEMAALPPGAERLDAALGLLWRGFEGPTFVAWVELWVAARTDPELADAVRAMGDAFQAGAQALLAELFPARDAADGAVLQGGLALSFAVMEGVALRGLLRPVDPVPLDLLTSIARERLRSRAVT